MDLSIFLKALKSGLSKLKKNSFNFFFRNLESVFCTIKKKVVLIFLVEILEYAFDIIKEKEF